MGRLTDTEFDLLCAIALRMASIHDDSQLRRAVQVATEERNPTTALLPSRPRIRYLGEQRNRP